MPLNKADLYERVATHSNNLDRTTIVAQKGDTKIIIKAEHRINDKGQWWPEMTNNIVLENHSEAKKLITALQKIVG